MPIKSYLKKITSYKTEIILSAAAIFIYFVIRLVTIKSFPIFIDEATYAWWAELGKFDAYQRLVSLSDGKQPLFIWITTFAMNYNANPVAAGRLVSVFAGFITLIGLFFLGKELFKDKFVGIISALIYAFFPFALVYNRLALYESLVGMFFIWSIYFEVLLIKHRRLDLSFTLALVLGGGLLTKTTGIFNIVIIPLSLILFPFKTFKRRIIIKKFLFWLILILFSLALSYLYYSVLFLSPDVFNIGFKNDVFSYKLADILTFSIIPHTLLNIKTFSEWIFSYTTLPFLLLVLLSLFNKKFLKENLYLILCFLIPFLILAVLGKLIHPRYLFFVTLPLIILSAECIVFYYRRLNTRVYACILSVILLLIFSFNDFKILYDFPRSLLPEDDLFQYANGWSAGYGMREIVSFLQNELSNNPIYAVTDGNYNSPTGGLATMMLKIYFMKDPRIEEHTLWPVPKNMPEEYGEIAKAKSVYIIFNQTQSIPAWPMDLVLEFRKGVGDYFVRLYKIKTPN